MIVTGKIARLITSIGGKWVAATTIGPFIFLADGAAPSARLLNHERIHIRQGWETLFVGMWVIYGLYYLQGRSQGKDHHEAYRAIPLEIEAYAHQGNPEYLKTRPWFNWRNY